MSTTQARHDVLVGVDGSAQAEAALSWAAAYAARRDLALRLLTAVDRPIRLRPYTPYPVTHDDPEALEAARRVVDGAVARCRAGRPALEVTGEVADEAPVPALLGASDFSALAVVGSRGLNAVMTAVLGSVSAALVGHAHCPVVVVRNDRRSGSHAPVVAGLDGSGRDAAILEAAFDEASRWGAPLIVVHAWSDTPLLAAVTWGGGLADSYDRLIRDARENAEKLVEEALTPWRAKYPDVSVRTRVRLDQPAADLISLSHDAGLLVVGSRGRGGFTGMLLGSVAQRVVHHADCPVLVVHGGPGDTD